MLLPCEMRAIILKRGLLRIITNCAVDLVAAALAFARAGENDWTELDCLGWFFFDFTDVTTIYAQE